MKTTGTTTWTSPNTDATNTSGWTGLPGGYRYFNGSFSSVGDLGYWWSSSQFNTTWAWYRYLYYANGSVFSSYNLKQLGFSVRCLRD